MGLDALDFGRRAAVEKDLTATTIAAIRSFIAPSAAPASTDAGAAAVAAGTAVAATARSGGARGHKASGAADAAAAAALPPIIPPSNAIFDDSGALLIYPCLLGIKIVNTVTNAVSTVLGRVEDGERFTSLALYQGTPRISSQYALARDAAAGEDSEARETSDLLRWYHCLAYI